MVLSSVTYNMDVTGNNNRTANRISSLARIGYIQQLPREHEYIKVVWKRTEEGIPDSSLVSPNG